MPRKKKAVKIDLKALADALKCSATPGGIGTTPNCRECKYLHREIIPDDVQLPADEAVDGVKYFWSCDCDRMALEAAAVVEAVSGFMFSLPEE